MVAGVESWLLKNLGFQHSNYRLREATLLWVSSGDSELVAAISWLHSPESEEEKWVKKRWWSPVSFYR